MIQNIKRTFFTRSFLFPVAPVILLLFLSCHVSLLAGYDESLYNGIIDFQKKTDNFLLKQQRDPVPPYNADIYDDIVSDLSVLKTRAASLEQNEQTTQFVEILISQVETIRKIHKEGAATPAFFQGAQKTIDDDCQRILHLEIQKKR
jgi:hypothetical protein